MIWLFAFLVSALVSLIATRLVMSIGISDIPDAARKLHRKITPTSGGLGIMAGFIAGLIYLYWDGAIILTGKLVMLVGACFVGGILGLLDDLFVLGAKRKLAVMLIASTFAVAWGVRAEVLELGPGLAIELGMIVGGIGSVFWLLVMVNTVNFTDGANGLSIGCSAISLFFLAALGAMASDDVPMLLAFIGCGGCIGFLRWNVAAGRIFAGDSGALFVGLLCGTIGLWIVRSGVNPLSVTLCFLPVLVDVILTVIRRIKHRENVLQPHSQHAYQALIRAGASHTIVAARYWMLTLMCCVAAVAGQHQGGFFSLIYFALLLGLLCLLHFGMLRGAKAATNSD
jgi:UDP-GlcNAc:undecaprenyl-phosphate/decaprenyl-phosphate GlcNAc-1-phosphate transferase